jgi:hypothetical protein
LPGGKIIAVAGVGRGFHLADCAGELGDLRLCNRLRREFRRKPFELQAHAGEIDKTVL